VLALDERRRRRRRGGRPPLLPWATASHRSVYAGGWKRSR
jgi:hypothetical protein